MIPNLVLPYVDVRDVADAQVAAMIAPDAGGCRHIVTNPSLPLGEIAHMLRADIPERADRIPTRHLPSWLAPIVALFDKSLRDSSAWLGIVRRYDGSSGANLLRRPLRSTSDALLVSARALLDRGLA